MALQEYAKKRDFKKTREPKAVKAAVKSKTSPLMFVVQEHHASHLHYDFRLEWEGVLKSWAVPKGPSLDPKTKRLAVQVEDHPLAYGKFEGTIAEGQYGAGEVYIWDTGIWQPDSDIKAGLKKGHIDFTLKGKRLKGSWTLIRTKATSGSKAQWLLFKRSDQFAKTGDVAEEIGSDEEHVLAVQTRTWKSRPKKSAAAAAAKPAVKAKTTTARRKSRQGRLAFIEPQLAQLVTAPPAGNDWVHEIKLDGYRMQAQVTPEEVHLLTRTGLDWTDKFTALVAPLQKLKIENAILDGEAVILDEKGRSSFQKLQNALKSHSGHNMFYYVFDILYLNGKDLRNKPLLERKKLLKEILPKAKSAVKFSEHFKGQGKELLAESCRLELEGIISKRADAHYYSGRKDSWQKSKCSSQQEFVIGGYTEGTGSRLAMGALLLGVYENKKLKFVGKCGTGFNEQSLKAVLAKLQKLEQDESPFQLKSPREKRIHWVKPSLSAEITFANWTGDGHLRVPVFKGLREDKPTRQIKKEVPRKQTEKSSTTEISHPDKIIFAKEKLTKQDVADYFQAVQKFILPEIIDRPLSLVRSPEGTRHKGFFQKHISGKIPPSLEPVDIKEKTETRQYVTAQSADSLTALVQMGAFEIHSWNCRKDDVEHPDQIVMDFDPGPGVSWKQVVAAAFDLKEILDHLKLKSYVKLSGGKGVHVHVPFAPLYSWEQIKNLSHSLARQMEEQDPEKYTSKIMKSHRGKKIFVDYLRNGRGATAVVPYSLRARPISAVAMPVEWKDLEKLKGADVFPLQKALEHIKRRKKDPWLGMHKNKQKIGILKPS